MTQSFVKAGLHIPDGLQKPVAPGTAPISVDRRALMAKCTALDISPADWALLNDDEFAEECMQQVLQHGKSSYICGPYYKIIIFRKKASCSS